MPPLAFGPTMTRRSNGSLLDRVPFVQSVVAGFVAWLATFFAIAIMVVAGEDTDDVVGYAGNIVYNAHFVDSKVKRSTPVGSTSDTYQLIAEGVTDLPELAYYAVPILVLAAVGVGLARAIGTRDPSVGAIAGALTAVGYAVLTVAGTYVFELSEPMTVGGQQFGTATATPTLGPMTGLVMGLLYPIVFGAIGGAIGTRL
jgi:hypothetical protein